MSFELGLVISILMLLGNAFFVGAEFAIISARRSNIELFALEGSRSARITLSAMEQVSTMLAGAQLGITVCTLVFGAVGEPLVAHLLEGHLHTLGVSDVFLHPISLTVALTLMVYLHVVIGEMIPKNISLTSPTKSALILAPPLVFFVKITRPIVYALNAVANACLRLIGIAPNEEVTSSFSRDEVAGFVKESHREGFLSEDEEQLLSGALEFDARSIKSVIMPIKNVVCADLGASAQDIESLASRAGFSRYPVVDKAGDLKGYVHIKDVINVSDADCNKPLSKKYIRPLVEVAPDTSLRRSLYIMQQSETHLAKVVDSNKTTVGIIALEDVLEELVGEIRDEGIKFM